jgi:outer membrane protein assembly factor BamB
MNRIVVSASVIGGLITGFAGLGQAQSTASEWSQFRGPDRSGVSAETGLLRSWPEGGPREVWRRSIGEGYSGVSIAGDRLCTMFAVGDEELLACSKVEDGEELWRLGIGGAFRDQFGSGPRSTPAIDGGMVYALGGKGRLVAASLATGEIVWQHELTEDFGFYGPELGPGSPPTGTVRVPAFGYSTSPLIEGDLLIFEAGTGDGKSCVALDKKTGETRWTALDEPGITYSSVMPATLGGRRQLLALRPNQLVSLTPEGEVLWRQPWSMTVAQPVVMLPDKVFLSTTEIAGGQGIPGALVLKIGGDGQGTAPETVWESRILRNYSAASVLWGESIFGFDNATLRCVAAATGEPCWARRGLGRGSLVAADGLLFVWGDQGELTLVEATAEEYRQLGQVRVFEDGRTWTPPSLAAGRLYLRGHTEVACLDVKG